MMNELHTVLAAGAGAVSRLKDPHGTQIERIFNFKYPYEYSERFATILERKQGIFDFYKRYPL
jgi:oxygen-independent coproporphyrinogen-3 oxidase